MGTEHLYEYWRAAKSFFLLSGRIDPDTAHIHLGLIGFFCFFALFRKRRRPEIKAWLCVFALQFLNECLDIFFDLRQLGTVREWDAIEDFTSTLFWPSVLVGFLWFYNKRSVRPDSSRKVSDQGGL